MGAGGKCERWEGSETLSAERVGSAGLQGLHMSGVAEQSQRSIASVTPRGVLLPTVCDVSATHEGS